MSVEIITGDALKWLEEKEEQDSFITSLPDWAEVNMEFDEWLAWFELAATLIIKKTKPEGYSIFYQTDRKLEGYIVDKSFLINKAAHNAGAKTIWHKIALKKDPGRTDPHRPTYTHLICISKEGKGSTTTPDVFYAGKMIYKNAMGLEACTRAIDFLKSKHINKVTDPFCGRGSVILIAAKSGMDAIGLDIDPAQTDRAKLILKQNGVEIK
jgi:DNA modification methylase